MKGLEEGETYVFRLRAVNANGVGKPSQLSEPVCAKALPGNNRTTCRSDQGSKVTIDSSDQDLPP